MTALTMKIYQRAQIRELEGFARDRMSISSDVLMQRAGNAALDFLIEHWPNAKHIVIVCGGGNNGGDGYVLAHAAQKRGLQVTIWQVGQTEKLSSAAAQAYDACLSANVAMQSFLDREALQQTDVIVDAIYGIGLQGEVRQEGRIVIEAINQSGVPVLSLDIPSGVDADTGAIMGVAIHATATMTFMGLKLGLLTGSGLSYTGLLQCHDLQLPEELFSLVEGVTEKMSFSQFADYLKPRPRDYHKGNAGHVLIVGGDVGFSGAVRMAAEAALRVGAGLVSVATHPAHAEMINLTCPEIMSHGVQSTIKLRALLKKATVVIVGPGLGQSFWSKRLLKVVLQSHLPLVVDADALNLIAKTPIKRTNWILTPHPGEAARLLQQTAQAVQQNRLAAAQKIQQQYEGVCVLKGAGTLIAVAHQMPVLCDAGNPGMATAGMGDVLSGVIGGWVAQGVPLAEAAKLGVYTHASAGDAAAKLCGERGMLAMDLIPFLHLLANDRMPRVAS